MGCSTATTTRSSSRRPGRSITEPARRWIAALALTAACAYLPQTAAAQTAAAQGGAAPEGAAAEGAALSARFIPMHLGQRTTLEFGFSFEAPPGQVPPPLVQIELRYPDELGLGLSGLGLATCTAQALEADGPGGCSPNATMGLGTVLSGIVLGATPITEQAPIAIMRAPDREGKLALLFSSEGTTPVATRIVFSGLLLPAHVPFGGLVDIGVPLVPTLPGAPYISVIHLRATIGPRKIVYYERVDGRTLAYQPRGILLPERCPRGGFPFAAQFRFLDGSLRTARTAIPCDPKRGRHRKRR
jgi:hypothetical protein